MISLCPLKDADAMYDEVPAAADHARSTPSFLSSVVVRFLGPPSVAVPALLQSERLLMAVELSARTQ